MEPIEFTITNLYSHLTETKKGRDFGLIINYDEGHLIFTDENEKIFELDLWNVKNITFNSPVSLDIS